MLAFGGVWFQCRYGGFWMSSCQLMFPGVRSSLVFSGFGLKPPATGFQLYSYSSLKVTRLPQGSRLLCWELSEASPGLYALPRSKLLRFRYSGTLQRHRLGWACVLCPSQVQAAQVTRCLVSAVPAPQPLEAASYRLPCPCCSVSWVYKRHTFSGGC